MWIRRKCANRGSDCNCFEHIANRSNEDDKSWWDETQRISVILQTIKIRFSAVFDVRCTHCSHAVFVCCAHMQPYLEVRMDLIRVNTYTRCRHCTALGCHMVLLMKCVLSLLAHGARFIHFSENGTFCFKNGSMTATTTVAFALLFSRKEEKNWPIYQLIVCPTVLECGLQLGPTD